MRASFSEQLVDDNRIESYWRSYQETLPPDSPTRDWGDLSRNQDSNAICALGVRSRRETFAGGRLEDRSPGRERRSRVHRRDDRSGDADLRRARYGFAWFTDRIH